MENAYIEEKEDACNALGEIATNVGWVCVCVWVLCLCVCTASGTTLKMIVLTVQF